MSWQNHNNLGARTGSVSKIRKRGCSSSSSSSLVRKYRFKRAILVGKRGGSSTQVPTWKTSDRSPSLAMENDEFPKRPTSKGGVVGGRGKDLLSVSARKLAATLWEINEVPSLPVKKGSEALKDQKKELSSRQKEPKLSRHLSDPCRSPISERMERSGGGGSHQRRISAISHKPQLTEYCLGALDSISSAGLVEIESHSLGKIHRRGLTEIKTRLKEVSNGLTTSKELLKVLNHVWGLQEQHSSGRSVVSALRIELDRARSQVDQLIREQRSNSKEIEYLMQHFAGEKATWKIKERERIRDAVACLAEELEVEKKLRRQTERLNKKLGKELADTKASLSKSMKELEREKRAKEILEQVCDELARGMGEDRAQVEELKKESAKAREEVEKEREMLQLADVLREERVQMKLSEAKYQFEEKNAAVDKLRNELEAYLRTKVGKENGDGSPKFEKIKELEAYLKRINFGSSQNVEKEEDEGEVADGEGYCEGDDSAESDLHSIELNMDNTNKSYKWGYVRGDDAQDDSRKVSVDKEPKGRKSLSEKIQWGSICLNRGISNGTNRELVPKIRENSNGFDQERLSEVFPRARTLDDDDENGRDVSIKGLSDRILSGPRIALVQSFDSPPRQWGEFLALQAPSNDAWESSMVLQGEDLMPKVAGTRGKFQT
ncbi:uncharacterized protein At5g41620-like [Juglans microcarpa x Juglans regia]|uniref:uncharacterized protein At5g41620-like n=1 Tax=Juglans microcarpa x Juglans regia TaxID=2249226 RepID=UPI001B7EA541|nr:uncharacterized protein At5g41620-like [Juglans microcarpa x Juglans regia]